MTVQLFRAGYQGLQGTSGEIWEYGMWVQTNGSGILQDAVASAFAASVSEFLDTAAVGSIGSSTTVQDFWCGDTIWTQGFAREYSVSTGLALGVGAARSAILDTAGTGSGVSLPYQVALAVTIARSGIGRTKWNRHFLPPLRMQPLFFQDNDHLDSDVTLSLVNATVALNTELATHEATLEIVHWSFHDKLITTHPAVRVGDVMDTQRRRRNKIPEAYESDDL